MATIIHRGSHQWQASVRRKVPWQTSAELGKFASVPLSIQAEVIMATDTPFKWRQFEPELILTVRALVSALCVELSRAY